MQSCNWWAQVFNHHYLIKWPDFISLRLFPFGLQASQTLELRCCHDAHQQSGWLDTTWHCHFAGALDLESGQNKQWCSWGHSGCLELPAKLGSWLESKCEGLSTVLHSQTVMPSSKEEPPQVWQASGSESVIFCVWAFLFNLILLFLTQKCLPKVRALFLVSSESWEGRDQKMGDSFLRATVFSMEL